MITTGDKNPSFGLALDGKPANVPNGHMHVEMDTSKVYFYDEKNDTWYEDTSSSGGGGGGGGGALVVTFGGADGLTPDKTNAEIAAAATAGQLVVFKWTRDDGIFYGIAYIALQSGAMTYAQASATNNMYDGMMSTMTYDGLWSSTEKYFS